MPRAIREPRATRAAGTGRSGFTLVELLVVVVIVMALAALSLAGMAGARRRVKIDRTRNTIRKIHEIVMPQYENYLRRRVPFAVTPSATTNALNRLVAIRQMMVHEMPDSWADVGTVAGGVGTGPMLAYAATKAALGTVVVNANGGAECLYMIASRGVGEADAMEHFRIDEVGDTDGDGAPEFLDAWGQPIEFIRWAPGFSTLSLVQKPDPVNSHDPLDPMRVDVPGYALIPLIVSQGPDGVLDLERSDGWNGASLGTVVNKTYGRPIGSGKHVDNVTNHDFITK